MPVRGRKPKLTAAAAPDWMDFIDRSFLSRPAKVGYAELLRKRLRTLGVGAGA